MLPSSGTDEMKAVCAALHVADGRSPSTNPQGHIEFSGVRFSYPSRPEVNVFSGLDLVVPSGSVTAVVGSSGSGHRHLILYSIFRPLTRHSNTLNRTTHVNTLNRSQNSTRLNIHRLDSPAVYINVVVTSLIFITSLSAISNVRRRKITQHFLCSLT